MRRGTVMRAQSKLPSSAKTIGYCFRCAMMAWVSTRSWCVAWACSAWKSESAGWAGASKSILVSAKAQRSAPNCQWLRLPLRTDVTPIRILLADDHAVVRDGLRALLEKQPDMAVVGEAADGRDSIRLAEEQSPDVVIM